MNLDGPLKVYGLSDSEVALLKKGNIQTITDILLISTHEIAKRCRAAPIEIKRIVDTALNAVPIHQLVRLDSETLSDARITTGEAILDNALNGGIRTGMVWEVVGESSAGKTQFALQLSLFVQLSPELGGLSGSTCYLTTSSKLPSTRLLEISQMRELPTSLEHVHTIATPTIAVLQRVLTTILPSFIEKQATIRDGKPVKLVVIDAIAELFHGDQKTTTLTLVERSKNIASISASLHTLASSYDIAILVLNEVVDVFDHGTRQPDGQGDLSYNRQSRWFDRVEGFGESQKRASLGLAWANQINARIMLSRTGRRKYLNEQDFQSKRQRLDGNSDGGSSRSLEHVNQQPTLIRRLSVIFSNVSLPISLDYIVTASGISILTQNGDDAHAMSRSPKQTLTRLDKWNETSIPFAGIDSTVTQDETELDGEDEFDKLWAHDDIDWDALDQGLSQTLP
ncbi:P-loop containing nucleoside triphosphate hydrolase protein [Crassisporium funariophilum]|nr:P-loop containing nucleoside triphosphate hydrolase protein [Crassisporium funariophilum]